MSDDLYILKLWKKGTKIVANSWSDFTSWWSKYRKINFNQSFSRLAFIQTHQANLYLELFALYMCTMSKSLEHYSFLHLMFSFNSFNVLYQFHNNSGVKNSYKYKFRIDMLIVKLLFKENFVVSLFVLRCCFVLKHLNLILNFVHHKIIRQIL